MSTDVIADLTNTVRQILLCLNVRKGLTTLEEAGLDEEDLGFWLDSEFYETDPDDNEIIGVQADALLGVDGNITRLLNDDIVTTYLKSGDLVLVLGTDGESTYMAGVDKDSGVGLLTTYDLEDEKWIADNATIALNNKVARTEGRTSDLKPLEARYTRLVLKPNELEGKRLDLSTKRLTEMLSDVLTQRLSVFTGKPVERRSEI